MWKEGITDFISERLKAKLDKLAVARTTRFQSKGGLALWNRTKKLRSAVSEYA